MPEQNASMAKAQALGGQGELAFLEHQDLRANQARVRHPAHQRHGDVKTLQARPEDGHDRQHQHQERERQHHVDHTHADTVETPADITRDRTDKGANDEREDHPDNRQLQVDARTPDHPRQDVPAVIVRTQRMGKAGGQQTDAGVLRDGVVGRDPRRKQRQGQPREQDQQTPCGGQPAIAKTKAQAQAPRGNQWAAAHCIFTRGSRATVTRSARKLTTTVAQASTIATPCTTM